MNTPAKEQHPGRDFVLGFPGVPGLLAAFAVILGGFWPALVWHGTKPDGTYTATVATWVACGIWWALLGSGAAWLLVRWFRRPGP